MTTIADENVLRRHLNTACLAIRNGDDGDAQMMSSFFQNVNQADTLLNLIAHCWRDTTTVPGSPLTNLTPVTGTASELLRVAMTIESIAHRAIRTVIDCIHSGRISGRSAIYCISEVRIALLSRDPPEKLLDLEFLMEAIENTKSIAEQCIRPFFAANKNQLFLQEATICLDLLPDSLSLLCYLRKKNRRSRKYETELLDTFMSNEWHPTGFLPICCALCEIYPHLKSRHLEEFKVRLLTSTTVLQEKQSEDFTGILRVCLRMFEQSRNACWIHVFRVLFSCVPRSELLTVEVLLEQIFTQAPLSCLQLISVIEDASAYISTIIGTSAVASTPPIRGPECSSRDEDVNAPNGVSSIDKSREKSAISPLTSPTYYPTHCELEGIPIITTMDIELLIVCSRAINGGQRVEGEIQLPAMLFDCSDRPSKGALAVSNALLLVVLSGICVDEYMEYYRIHTSTVGHNGFGSTPDSRSHSRSQGDQQHESQQQIGPTPKQSTSHRDARHKSISGEDREDSTTCRMLSGTSSAIRRLLSSSDAQALYDSQGDSSASRLQHCSVLQSSAMSSSHSATATATAASSSSYSEGHTIGDTTWANASKSTELVAACLYMSCCPHLVNQRISLISNVVRAVRTARKKHELYSMSAHSDVSEYHEGEDLCGGSKDDQDVPTGSAVVAQILVTTFEAVSVCRPAILTSLLKGLLVCGDYVSHKHGISSRSHGLKKDVAHTAHSVDVQNMIIRFACAVYHSALHSLCRKFPSAICDMTNVLDVHVPLLSLLPLPMLPTTLFPIIRISGHSAGLLSCILNAFRKLLLHKDLDKKAFAIQGLVALLAAVSQDDQIRVMQTLFHAFSLQLPCRRVLYAELINLLTSPLLFDANIESSVYSDDNCDDDVTGRFECNDSSSHFNAQSPPSLLSPQLLAMISQKVNTRLGMFLESEESSTTDRADAESRSRFLAPNNSNTTQFYDNATQYPSKALSADRCIESFYTLKGREYALGEDFSLLVALSHVLSTSMCEADTASDIVRLSEAIIGSVPLTTRNNSRPEGSRTVLYPGSDDSGIEVSRSGRDLGSLNGADLGPAGSFLLAVVHFIADGFPMSLSGGIDFNADSHQAKDSEPDSRTHSINNSSTKVPPTRSLEVNVPLYSTPNLKALSAPTEQSKEVAVKMASNLTEKLKKEEERMIKIVHFALCYSLVTGLLRALTSTLLTVKRAASGTGRLPGLDEVENTKRILRCAIAHVQGLLDLILEISIDLSSSAPVIPIQGPGLAILKQGPGSGKNSKNSPVEIAVKPLNSHGSMSDLVTAKLTGMANLSLVGRGERDVFSPLSGCPQPLSFESSLLLIETALEMLPSPSATELEESCGRDLGAEVPTGALSLSVPSVPTHLQSRALGDSISHPSPEQHAAVLYAAVPLSVRVGALGHACHQAAATAICAPSTISHDSNLSVGPFSRTPSSVQSCLIKLLLAVFEAYKRTATIGVEDLFLAEAEDAAEALIRGEPSSKSVALPLSTSSATRRQGAERGAIELTGPRSHLSWRGQGSDSLSGPQALSSSGKVVLEGDEAARGRIGLSSAIPADTSAGNSNSTDIGCSKRSSSGSRIAGGTQDPPLRHRRSGQLEQSANVGIPMSCVKDKKISAPGWSDDSSEDSGAESIVEDDAQRNLSSGAMGHTRAKSSPAGILSQSVVHLSTAVQSCLDRYDLPCSALKDFQREYDTASSGIHTRSNSRSTSTSNNAAERAVQRVRTAASESMRYTLFALRCEMLCSSAKILRAMGAIDSMRCAAAGTEIAEDPGSLPISKKLELAAFLATELHLAIADGLTVRTLMAYLDVLQALSVGLGSLSNVLLYPFPAVPPASALNLLHDPVLHGTAVSTAPLHAVETSFMSNSVASTIQSTLKLLDYSHQTTLSSMVHLIMQYSGPIEALKRCSEFIRTIGSMKFARKEKKKSVLTSDCQDGNPPKCAMSPPRAVVRAPLSMATRSADVELFSSSSGRLLKVSTDRDLSSAADHFEPNAVAVIDSVQTAPILSGDDSESSDYNSGSDEESRRGLTFYRTHPKGTAPAPAPVETEEGLVTAKSSDALLGYVLRHVERSMATLVRSLLNKRNVSASDRAVKAVTHPQLVKYGQLNTDAKEKDAVASHTTWEKQQIELRECIGSDSNQTLARHICHCIFALFGGSPRSSGAASSSEGIQRCPVALGFSQSVVNDNSASEPRFNRLRKGNIETSRGTPACDTSSSACTPADNAAAVLSQLLLQNVSERRKYQVLSMATQYMYQCIRDCLNLLKQLLSISKDRMQLSKRILDRATGNDGRKRRRGESGHGNSKYDRVGQGRRKKDYSFSDDDDDVEEEEEEEVETRNDDAADIMESAIASPSGVPSVSALSSRPHTATALSDRPFSFLEALLSVVEPSLVIGAKEWILRKSTKEPTQSGKTVHQTPKVPPSKGKTSKEDKGSKSVSNAGVLSDKRAHSLIFKIEEFEWRLLSVLQELDRQRDWSPVRQRKRASGSKETTAASAVRGSGLYPPPLASLISLLEGKGRTLLTQLHASTGNRAGGTGSAYDRTYLPWKNASAGQSSETRRRQGKRGRAGASDSDDSSDESDPGSLLSDELSNDDDDDDEEGADDGEDRITGSQRHKGPSSISKRSQVSIQNAASAGTRSSLSRRGNNTKKSKSSAGSSKRLRSRNSVIDDWLADEDGSDTYADLEDFLVE